MQIVSQRQGRVIKARLCVVSENSLSQLLNWASPSLLRGLPIDSSVIVGRWPARLSPAPSISPSATAIPSIFAGVHVNTSATRKAARALPIAAGERQIS